MVKLIGNYFKSNKGSVGDGIYFMVALVAIAIAFIIGWVIFQEIDDRIQSGNQISAEGKSVVTQIKGDYLNVTNNAFLLIFIGLLIALVIGAWLIPIHPAIFWISIPIMVFIVFLAAIYGNFFYAFTESDDIASSAADFTIVTFIFNNYVYFITGVVLLLALFLFAKNRLTSIE